MVGDGAGPDATCGADPVIRDAVIDAVEADGVPKETGCTPTA